MLKQAVRFFLVMTLYFVSHAALAQHPISDIAEHPYQQEIISLVELGYWPLAKDQSEFRPDDAITLKDYLAVLKNLNPKKYRYDDDDEDVFEEDSCDYKKIKNKWDAKKCQMGARRVSIHRALYLAGSAYFFADPKNIFTILNEIKNYDGPRLGKHKLVYGLERHLFMFAYMREALVRWHAQLPIQAANYAQQRMTRGEAAYMIHHIFDLAYVEAPEPTPEPSPVPTPTPTPTPDPTPPPIPTPVPTPPDPTPLPTPVATPTPDPTPIPTPIATPTPTPLPTPEPTPQATPSPTPLPDPTPYPEVGMIYYPYAVANNATCNNTIIENGEMCFIKKLDQVITSPNKIKTTDLDQNGVMDIIVGSNLGSITTLYYQSISSTSTVASLIQSYSASVANINDFTLADFDGDGDQDIVTSNNGSQSITPMRQNLATQQFSVLNTVSLFAKSRFIVAGDFNGDNLSELVTSSYEGNTLEILDGQIPLPTTTSLLGNPDHPAQIKSTDLDGDGFLDLIAVMMNTVGSNGELHIYYGLGNADFTAPDVIPLNQAPYSLAIADLNHDGNQDIVVGEEKRDITSPTGIVGDSLAILLGQGSRQFQGAYYVMIPQGPAQLEIADVNHDQNPDIVVLNRGTYFPVSQQWQGTANVTMYLGEGDGFFNKEYQLNFESNPNSIFVSDLNQDGSQDLLITIPSLNRFRMLFQSN